MNFEKTVKKTVDIYIKNWIILSVSTLVVFALGILTLGFLFGPLTVSLGAMFLKAKSGKKPVFDDLFKFNSKFFSMAVMGLLSGILICMGFVLLVLPGILLATLWMYSFYSMAFDNKGVTGSMKKSWDFVMKKGLWQHVVVFLAIGIFNSIGGAVAIGILVTFPITSGFLALVYKEHS